MGILNVSGMWVPIVMTVWFLGFTMGNGQKINGKIDLVFIAPASPYTQAPSDMPDVKEAWRNHLLDHVEMGKDTKIAILVHKPGNTGIPELLVNLTNDKTAVQDGLNRWPVDSVTFHSESNALATIRDQIFDFSQSDRAKVVIHYLHNFYHPNGEKEAASLRGKGVFLYYIWATNGRGEENLPGVALDHSGSESRVFNQTWEDIFSKKSFDRIPDVIAAMTRDLCTFCHFENKKRDSCKPKTRLPGMKISYFNDNNAKCTKIQPGDFQCNKGDCEMECDRQWPWKKAPNCTVFCGKIQRNGTVPSMMENCPSDFKCSSCPTAEAEPEYDPGIEIAIWCSVGALIFILIIVSVVAVLCFIDRRRSADQHEQSKRIVEAKSDHIEIDLGTDGASGTMQADNEIQQSACEIPGHCPKIYVRLGYNADPYGHGGLVGTGIGGDRDGADEVGRGAGPSTQNDFYYVVNVPQELAFLLRNFNVYQDRPKPESSIIEWDGFVDPHLPIEYCSARITKVTGRDLAKYSENVRKLHKFYLIGVDGKRFNNLMHVRSEDFIEAIREILQDF